MKAEWNYLVTEAPPSDLPIADSIWKHLPRRIDEKVIPVIFSFLNGLQYFLVHYGLLGLWPMQWKVTLSHPLIPPSSLV